MVALTRLDRVLQREKLLLLFALTVVIGSSWAYLVAGGGTMQEMGEMTMPMSIWPWTITHAGTMLFMWMVMMTAMMLPSATPAILLYSHINRRSADKRAVAPALFSLGYLTVWMGFSLVAVVAQFLLEWTGYLSAMMESSSATLSGTLLVAAGLYQLTPYKYACLRACRSPLEFLMLHWHVGVIGALRMGVRHGAYCVACCWALMLLLFVGGVMNLIWIVGLTIYVLIEKLMPSGRHFTFATGAMLIAAGALTLATSFR